MIKVDPLQRSDAEEFYLVIQNGRRQLETWLPELILKNGTPEKTAAWVADHVAKAGECGVPDLVIRYQGMIAGLISTHPPDLERKSIELGFWLGGSFEGKGIATQALKTAIAELVRKHGLQQIDMTTAEKNERARAVATRLGFQFVGLEPDAEVLHGLKIHHARYRLNLVNDANREAYEAIARVYAGEAPAEDDPEMREECRMLFARRLAGKDVLEIGCGPGVDSSKLQQMGLNVTATDFSDTFVEIVKARFPLVRARRMDMTLPDLPEASFDGIYGFASFVHLPRPLAEETLRRLGLLLKPGGVMFLSLIESDQVREYTIPDWGGRPDNPVLFTCYSREEIEVLLKQAGFSKVVFHSVRSLLYESLPRLVEKGVKHYQVLALRFGEISSYDHELS